MFAAHLLQINLCKTVILQQNYGSISCGFVEIISAVSECCLALHKGVCGRREQRGGWRSCERGIPSDPAVNETFPVPLSVLTGRLCHTIQAGAAAWLLRSPSTSLSSILSCQYQKKKKKSVSWVLAFGLVDMFVAQQAKAIPPVKPRQRERKRKKAKNFFLYNQSLGKFDSLLNGKKKKKKSSGSWNRLLLFSQTFQLVQKQ